MSTPPTTPVDPLKLKLTPTWCGGVVGEGSALLPPPPPTPPPKELAAAAAETAAAAEAK